MDTVVRLPLFRCLRRNYKPRGFGQKNYTTQRFPNRWAVYSLSQQARRRQGWCLGAVPEPSQLQAEKQTLSTRSD